MRTPVAPSVAFAPCVLPPMVNSETVSVVGRLDVIQSVGANVEVLDVNAVKRDLRPRRAGAVDGGAGAPAGADTRLRADEADDVAAVQGQVLDGAGADVRGHFRSRRVDEFLTSLDFDHFTGRADHQLRRQRVFLRRFHPHILIGGGRETRR